MVDVWDRTFRRLKIARLLGKVDCPCCQRRDFEWLDGGQGSQTTTLCGRNAVQVATRRAEPLELRRDGRPARPAGRGQLQRASCSSSPPRATSSRSSPTAGPSSRGPTTSPRRGRSTPSSSGSDARGTRPSSSIRAPTMIYLDNAATSFPKPEPVYQALDAFARTRLANPGRAGHRMATGAERVLDEARHGLNQFFRGEAPERWIFTLNCTDGLNLAIKGTVKPGDHVITSDLEHNSISRPLRALEKAGVITLTRLASDRGYLDPDAIRRALTPTTSLVALTHAANVLGTVQPIEADRADRPRGGGPLPGRRRAVGGRRPDRPPGHADRPARLPRPQGPLRPDRHRGPLRRAARQARAPGARGAPGGDSSSETQPPELPYFLEGGTPNVLGVAGPRRGARSGSSSEAPRASAATRSACSSASSTGSRHADGWQVAGRWDPATHVGALSLIAPDGPLTRRTSARSSTPASRSPSAPACTAPLHPSRPRHLPRRHAPAQPRPVHHGRGDRRLPQRPHRDHRGGALTGAPLEPAPAPS